MTDFAEIVDAYEHTVRAHLALAADATAEDADRPTECPGWTVRDQLAHVVSLERWMGGEPWPEHRVPEGLEHVRTPLGRLVEVGVDARRGRSLEDVAAELAEVLTSRLTALRGPGTDPGAETPSPLGGTMPLRSVLSMRTFDIWTHEQDVRRALGRPGNLGSQAAQVSVGWLRRSLPRVVARAARLPVGTVVAVDVTGEVPFADVVVVREGDGGKPVGAVVDPGADGVEPRARLVLTTEAFTRRSAGRWAVEHTPAEVSGDEDAARAVLTALAVTP
ncbi:maleylpyruvate isomerase family mycothiol-dependent enzyme [Thalassiella azotivora]